MAIVTGERVIKLEKEIAALRAECEQYRRGVESWKAEEAIWHEHIAKLRAALEPFVEDQPNMPPEGGWMLRHQKNCQRARAALAEPEKAEEK